MMNQYFDELITLLAMVSERNIPRKMDKATTLKEAVNCIRIYYELGKTGSLSEELPKVEPVGSEDITALDPKFKPCFLSGGEILSFILEAHDTFLIIISESGRILYSTELITSLLGHMQTRLVGQNIFDYVLEEDKELIVEMFKPSDPSAGVQIPDSPVIQYPCQTFQCHLKLYSGETSLFPQYLPFSCLWFLRQWSKSAEPANSSQPPSPVDPDAPSPAAPELQSCILLLGKLPTSLTLIDLPISTNDVNFEFEMRVSREGTIIHVDKHAMLVFGFTPSEVIGSSIFEYVDPYHIVQVGEAMAGFLSSGIGTTTPYRILSKGNRYIWLISKGYLSYNPWNHKPDHILLSNRVLGCDHVLPEHRFFRSRKLLPDLEGEESYTPPASQLPVSVSSPPPPENPVPTPSVSVPYSLPLSSNPILPNPQIPTPDLGPSPAPVIPSQPDSVLDIQKELERNKQELFDLQRKLLEQQQLMEQERAQFYQVTQQVMQCIGNNPNYNGIPSNLQVAMGNPPQMQMSPMPLRPQSKPLSEHSFKSPQLAGARPVRPPMQPSPGPSSHVPSPGTPARIPTPATNTGWGHDLMASSYRNPNPNYLPTYTPPPPPTSQPGVHNPLIPFAYLQNQQHQHHHHHQQQPTSATTGYPFHIGGVPPSTPSSLPSLYSPSVPPAHFRSPSPFPVSTTPVRLTSSLPSLPSVPSPYPNPHTPFSPSNLMGTANTTAGTLATTSSHLPGISTPISVSAHLQQQQQQALPQTCYTHNLQQQHQSQQQHHYGSFDQLPVTCGPTELTAQTSVLQTDYLRNLLCITNSDNSSSSRNNVMSITTSTCTSMQ